MEKKDICLNVKNVEKIIKKCLQINYKMIYLKCISLQIVAEKVIFKRYIYEGGL